VRRLPARKTLVLIAGLLLVVLLGAAWAGTHGRWLDPDARLVDGTWIGGPIDCPPEVDRCARMRSAALSALTDAERSRVASVVRVALPTQWQDYLGGRRTAWTRAGIVVFVAALVTLDDGQQRVVGLGCASDMTHCNPSPPTWWRDGGAPPWLPFGLDANRG
jgi:hypothetical protein